MRIVETKKGVKVFLKDYPTAEHLKKLNGYNIGTFYLDDSNGYTRLLHRTPAAVLSIVMECPINQEFTI